jgi:hypothetical protein
MAVDAIVGNGDTILFWSDRWINGNTMAEIAPNLYKAVPKRVVRSRTVAQALNNSVWASDIKGALTVPVLLDYFRIWDLLDRVVLQQEVQDHFRWKLTQTGTYSSKSAYEAFFVGSIKFVAWRRIWRSWAPLRCKFFIWLALKGRIWTADRLAKRGLEHPDACPLCDQAQETAQHLLLSCVFTRQVWFFIFQYLNLVVNLPTAESSSFSAWWCNTIRAVPKDIRKGLNSLIILVAWEVWKHCNSCVFEGARPSIQILLQTVANESSLWWMAGASKLQELLTRSLVLGT